MLLHEDVPQDPLTPAAYTHHTLTSPNMGTSASPSMNFAYGSSYTLVL